MGEEVVITYETLFELYRREKNRGDLQELDKKFYSSVIEYLKQKKSILNNDQDSDNIFAENERIKAEKQLLNIKKILIMLYELRAKKIVDMAWIKSRDPNFFIDDDNLLKEEKVLYNGLISKFDASRKNLLLKVLNTEIPILDTQELKKEECKVVLKDELKDELKSDELNLKIVKDTPEFCDAEMNMLGPFAKDEIVQFSKNIAEILLEKGFAEVIQK